MGFPFTKTKENEMPTNAELKNDSAPPEKTPAELIAASIKEALQPIAEGQARINERLDSIEQGQPKPRVADVLQSGPVSVFEDEDAAFGQRVGPIAMRQLETEARLALSDVKQEYLGEGYGEAWKKFEPEIRSTLERSPIVENGKICRGDPSYIRNVVDMIFGREARKAGLRFDGKDKGFFIESAGGSTNPSAPPVEDGQTEAQRHIFARMKVSPEDARKTMSKLKFVN